jgi:heme-degrading monooxygenase HmoA
MDGDPMAVLVRISATGMDQATYDQMAPNLHPLVKKQPGFIIHFAYPIPTGFAIGEVWESQAQHEAWFNEFVKPNLPESNAMTTDYSELHAIVQP